MEFIEGFKRVALVITVSALDRVYKSAHKQLMYRAIVILSELSIPNSILNQYQNNMNQMLGVTCDSRFFEVFDETSSGELMFLLLVSSWRVSSNILRNSSASCSSKPLNCGAMRSFLRMRRNQQQLDFYRFAPSQLLSNSLCRETHFVTL